MLDTVFFYIFALLAVLGALLCISRRNAVHCAVWLMVSLLGVAGLYLLQQAEFLFAVQIVLYIGGIMVLFLFVIMLVNLDQATRERRFNRFWWLGATLLGLTAAEFLLFLRRGTPLPGPTAVEASTSGNTQQIADVLFQQYALPFEIASLLLLVAIVGSVVMAKKRI
jgi:NADH-quinone oxidoreductase subunit J